MAIINSVFMGRAQKSAGNGTFRTVRGRTIVSQKVAKRGTIVGNLSKNQFALAVISRFASVHATDIQNSFDKTTYGSERNAFFKLNYGAMKEAVSQLYLESLKVGAAKLPSDAEIEQAIATYAAANPNTIYRVKKAGHPVIYLSGEWSSDANPSVVLSVEIGNKVYANNADSPLLKSGQAIEITFDGSIPTNTTISAKTYTTPGSNPTMTTLEGNNFATLSSSADNVLIYSVASGASDRYLSILYIGGVAVRSFKTLSDDGTNFD